MNFYKKDPLIFLIAGRARSGKGTVAKFIEEYFKTQNKKIINSPYTKYLKKYIEDITNEIITDENKPRELLQKISSELIKKELNKPNFFLDRQLEDLEIYSYFADVIIVSDVRFIEEIKIIKDNFKNVISIGVIRPNYKSDLTKEQDKDITETALDDYNDYDFKIINDKSEVELYNNTLDILKKIEKEGI